jgi:hypothetical protein
MTGLRPAIALVIGLLALLLGGAAQAQEDLSAGKTPEQLFRQNCSACHKSPRGLAGAGEKAAGLLSGLEGFLAQHYTASGRSAQIIAGYLKSVDSGASRRGGHPRGRATRSHKPDKTKTGKARVEKPKADAAKAKMTDEKAAKPKTDKPAMTKPAKNKKKPVSHSSQAKREKPVPTEKKTD